MNFLIFREEKQVKFINQKELYEFRDFRTALRTIVEKHSTSQLKWLMNNYANFIRSKSLNQTQLQLEQNKISEAIIDTLSSIYGIDIAYPIVREIKKSLLKDLMIQIKNGESSIIQTREYQIFESVICSAIDDGF